MLEVRHDGRVKMKQYESVSISCDINMTDYPADTQVCANIYSTFPPSSDIGIVFTNVTFAKHEHFENSSEYRLLSLEVQIHIYFDPVF